MTDRDAIAVLYSGGTDSTLTAYKAAQQSEQVHLLTYRRVGMVRVENSETNIVALRGLLGASRFVRPPLMSVDRLFRHVSYERYLTDLRRHGFMLLTTCGQCKLAMHLRTLVYCHDHGVPTVWDGANQNMSIFPAQMVEVIGLMQELYAMAGIRYETPVFEYEDDQGMDFGSALYGLNPARYATPEEPDRRTTGRELHELGILPEPDVKGTAHDKKMQARCYQFVLFNLCARWYYLERNSLDQYKERVIAYYGAKIERSRDMVARFLDDPRRGELRRLAGGPR